MNHFRLRLRELTSPTCSRVSPGDDACDLRQDPPSKLLASYGESTALGIGQSQRPPAQLLPEDPILLPEIVDQVFLVAVHPASDGEHEEVQRMRHRQRLPDTDGQHRPELGDSLGFGSFFAPYGVGPCRSRRTSCWTDGGSSPNRGVGTL